MRDPFANYDSWLEKPYQDMYANEDRNIWIAENTTYTTQCCDTDVTAVLEYDSNGNPPKSYHCVECDQTEPLNENAPELPDRDYDEPDYFDDPPDRD
jgi:hypothetical protein